MCQASGLARKKKVMKIKDPYELIGALVTMGGDPFLIETAVQAQNVFNVLSGNGLDEQLAEIEINNDSLSYLELTQKNHVRALYSFSCSAGFALMCLPGDWEVLTK